MLLEGVDDELLVPPVNALRLALHPKGIARRVLNLAEWRGHLLHRLERVTGLTGDQQLVELQRELLSYPAPAHEAPPTPDGELMVGLKLATADGGELSFFSVISTFGTALDVTVAELSIEAFFPADARTGAALTEAAAEQQS